MLSSHTCAVNENFAVAFEEKFRYKAWEKQKKTMICLLFSALDMQLTGSYVDQYSFRLHIVIRIPWEVHLSL